MLPVAMNSFKVEPRMSDYVPYRNTDVLSGQWMDESEETRPRLGLFLLHFGSSLISKEKAEHSSKFLQRLLNIYRRSSWKVG